MFIAASAVAIAVASSFAKGAVAPLMPPPPPIVVNLSAPPNLSASLVTSIVVETDSIFRSAGVSFIWRRAAATASTLTVTIGDDPGATHGRGTPLGWIVFEDGRPNQEIYLSYANAEKFVEDSRGVVARTQGMTRSEHETMLGRTMGRALAHELGHYLLASKAHTPHGLMKAARTAQEFFAFDRKPFQLEVAQRVQMAARLNREAVIADLQPSSDAVHSRRGSH
jgi:hypothetical protein